MFNKEVRRPRKGRPAGMETVRRAARTGGEAGAGPGESATPRPQEPPVFTGGKRHAAAGHDAVANARWTERFLRVKRQAQVSDIFILSRIVL